MAAEPSWVRQAGSRIDPALKRELERLYQGPAVGRAWVASLRVAWNERFRRLPILVQWNDGDYGDAGQRVCQWLARAGCRRQRRLDLVRAVAVEAPVHVIRRLAADPAVARLSLDRPVRALLDVATPTVRAPVAWALGCRGTGVTIAVLDTGIYPHADFQQPRRRLIAFHDVLHGRTVPYDDNGHGTHVAGIAAGNGIRSAGRYVGVAPEAALVGVKVLDAQGFGRTSDVIAGIDWICRNAERYAIRVLNISLGAEAHESYRNDVLAQAVAHALKRGLVVCAAAGNAGPASGTIGTPAIHPDVITVGASSDRRTTTRADDVVAEFSSRGPTPDGLNKPDLVAPGVEITAANAPGSTLARQQGDPAQPYITLSGTSMATPIVSGIAALLLERQPAWTPTQVKQVLLATATSMGLPPNVAGKGLVNAEAALIASGGPPRHTNGVPSGDFPDRRVRA